MDFSFADEIKEVINSPAGSDARIHTAVPAEYRNIRCVFHKPYKTAGGGNVEWEDAEPFCDCYGPDVANVLQDDTILIEEINYKITEIQPLEEGWVRLILYKENS